VKAARLHAYGEHPIVEEIAEPVMTGPFDVLVRVGGARSVPHGPARHRRSVFANSPNLSHT